MKKNVEIRLQTLKIGKAMGGDGEDGAMFSYTHY
jgi:hypothetical protein